MLDPNSLKLLTRQRLGLNNLNKHKFNHYFKEWANPLCSCSLQVESVSHFFLHCHYFTDIRKTLFNELQSVDENILNQSDNEIVELLLYGSNKFKGCVHFIFASLFLGLNESSYQIKKNIFYFTSKHLFILEKIKFQKSTFSNFMTSSNT